MTILKVACERGDFDDSGLVTTVTSSTYINTDRVRHGLQINQSVQEAMKVFFAESGEVSVSFTFSSTDTPTSSTHEIFELSDGELNAFHLRGGTTNSQIDFRYLSGGSYVTLYSFSFTSTEKYRFTVHYKIAVSGFIRVYSGAALLAEYTGDTSALTSATAFDRISFGSFSTSTPFAIISEVIVADELTKDMVITTIGPDEAGASNTMASGTYADVDEVGLSMADLMTATAAGQKVTMGMSDVNAAVAGDMEVLAVVVTAHMSRGATGPQNANALARVGGTDYNLGALLPGATARACQVMSASNPATGLPWTRAEIDAAEFGIEAAA